MTVWYSSGDFIPPENVLKSRIPVKNGTKYNEGNERAHKNMCITPRERYAGKVKLINGKWTYKGAVHIALFCMSV